MPNRTNAATSSTATSTDPGTGPETATDPFERVTEDGTDYLVAPVVAQQEDVYAYPINGRIQREFLPGEELTNPLDGWEGVPIVLRHPDPPPEGQPLLSEPGVEGTVVGAFREAHRTNGDERLAGKVYIRESELGDHDGDLRGYVAGVRLTGVGEVSTGYDVGTLTTESGRHNDTEYTHTQRDIRPDHIALLPDQIGNCPVEAGVCGVGRANDSSGDHSRVNHYRPESAPVSDGTDDAQTTAFARLGRRVAELVGLDTWRTNDDSAATDDSGGAGSGASEADAAGPTDDETGGSDTDPAPDGDADAAADAGGSDESQATRRAESREDAAKTDNTPMSDDDPNEQIETLVSDHGFDRENMEALEGTQCLSRIHEMATAAEESDAGDAGTDTPETPEAPAGADGTEGGTETDGGTTAESDDPLGDADVEDLIAQRVDERLESAFDEQAETFADRVDEARQNQQHIEAVAASDQYPLEREDLEGMAPDAVAKLADNVDTSPQGEEGRANYSGLASGSSFDAGDVQSDDGLDSIPAPGQPPAGESGGDD